MDSKVVKYILIGVGVYLVYRYLQTNGYLGGQPAAQAQPTALPASTPREITQPAAVTTPVAALPAPVQTTYQAPSAPVTDSVATLAADIKARMAEASASDTTGTVAPDGTRLHNYLHYNFMFRVITGQSFPDPAVLGIDPNEDMDFETFWGIVTRSQAATELAAGLHNLGSLYRLASAWS